MDKSTHHQEHDASLKGFYAGFVSRLIAFVIDAAIVTMTIIILGWAVTTILGFFGITATNLTSPKTTLPPYLNDIISIIVLFIIPTITFSIWITYYVGFWVLMGQTIGKQLMGLKVVSVDNKQITIKQGVVRYFGYWVSAILFFAGYWWVLLDDERRGWHDHMAKTCVIYVWDARTGKRLRDLLLRVTENDNEQVTSN